MPRAALRALLRFLFGFPFALVFLAGVMLALGQALPRPPVHYWPWVIAGALTQIAATALMLAAMNERRRFVGENLLGFVDLGAFKRFQPFDFAERQLGE